MRKDEEILIEMGERIRKEREAREWSQADLASKMSTSTGQVSLLENGKREPGLFMLRRIRQTLGIVLSDLIDEP